MGDLLSSLRKQEAVKGAIHEWFHEYTNRGG